MKRGWWGAALAVVIAGIYTGSLWYALSPATKSDVWVSPDEAATAAFARAYAQTGYFMLPEPENPDLAGILGPRSMVARSNTLVPGGFLGLPWIAGVAVWLLGDGALGWMSPVFAGLGVLAWGDAWRRLAGKRIGLLSAVLVAVHPAWLLYATRPLMPNVPFVALLMMSFWALVVWPRRALGGALSGLFFAAALMIRTAEAVWLLPVVCCLFLVYRGQYTRHALAAFFVGSALVMGAFAGQQAATYGHALTTGYTYREATTEVVQEDRASTSERSMILATLFPFGIHERSIARHAWWYGWALQWWWSLPATLGAGWIVATWKKRALWERTVTIGTVGVAAWLAVVYGSWTFFDNPDPSVVTLGNSYARYFLPAFVGASPLAAVVLARGKKVTPLIIATIAACSLALVTNGPDGWRHVRGTVAGALEKREGILRHVPEDAVLIMDRSDKYLVGYHQHILVPLRDPTTYASLPQLVARGPVYYFGLTLPPQDVDYLQRTVLAPKNLGLTTVQTIDDETLYLIH